VRAGRAAPVVAVLCVGACAAGTTLKESWQEPSLSGPLQFEKVLALVIAQDEPSRRLAEAELVSRLRVPAAAGFSMLSEGEMKDPESAKKKLRMHGFDGAIILRVVSVDEQYSWVAGAYAPEYQTFWGYYGWAKPPAADQTGVATNRTVVIESNVYSIADDKLLWSGVSQTMNPSSVSQLIDDIARAVVADLEKRGLVSRAE
jgi:hypothetical protein